MTGPVNRIIFMGTPDFAVPSLKALLDSGENVVSVITQPDRPKGRGRKLTPPPVKELALQAGLPVLQPEKVKEKEFLATLEGFNPDLIVLTAYGRILPGSLINLPLHGTINVHASLLPKYRGAAPVQWALINGEAETGVTIMQMDEGLDTGDILLAEKLPISPDDTAGSLFMKLAELGGIALQKALAHLRANKLTPIKQDDSLATHAPLLKKEDGLVNWSKSAEQISCLIRGLDPWPTTYTTLSGKRFRLFSPMAINQSDYQFPISEPGMVCQADHNGLVISTGSGYLLIREVQPEGSRRMDVDAYLRGHPIEPGTRLGQ
jgi:methionyl-tRNA formyltransferase